MQSLILFSMLLTAAALPADLAQIPFDHPVLLGAIAAASVQRELDISEQQAQQIAELKEQFENKDVSQADLEAKIKDILNAQQFQRLQQITWQLRPYEALRSDLIAAELELDDDDTSRLQKLWDEFQPKLVGDLRRIRFKSAEARQQYIAKRLQALTDEMLNSLTDQQREKFQQLLGEPIRAEEQ